LDQWQESAERHKYACGRKFSKGCCGFGVFTSLRPCTKRFFGGIHSLNSLPSLTKSNALVRTIGNKPIIRSISACGRERSRGSVDSRDLALFLAANGSINVDRGVHGLHLGRLRIEY